MIAIYARQSVEKKDSISIEAQIDHAKREIFSEDYQVYQDAGYSGKNTNRPAFHQMMDDVRSGRIEKVVVYRLDRISRSILDFADFINVLEEHEVSFVSATEKFDTSSPMGRAMLYIIVVFAQLERETIAERVKDNYYARVKKGAWGGGPAAFGFDLVRTTLNGKAVTGYRSNQDIHVVSRIFELYSHPHTSLADIQRKLISEDLPNIPTPRLSLILKNPSYVMADISIYNYYKSKGVIMANDPEDFNGIHGCILVGKRNANDRKYTELKDHLLAIGLHEGIVDSQTFLYCQNKLASNKQIKNTFKGKHSWLTGLVSCQYCGYSMSVRHGTTKEGRTAYLVCSGKYLHHKCDAKQTHRVEDVEAVVAAELINEASSYALRKAQRDTTVATELQHKIADIDARIENLLLSLESASAVSLSYINSRIEALHEEKVSLTQQYNEAILIRPSANITPFTQEDWDTMSFDSRQDLARSMIDRVFLSRDGVTVNLK